MRHARAGHRAGFFVVLALFTPARLLRRAMVRPADCCVSATWVRSPKTRVRFPKDRHRPREAPRAIRRQIRESVADTIGWWHSAASRPHLQRQAGHRGDRSELL